MPYSEGGGAYDNAGNVTYTAFKCLDHLDKTDCKVDVTLLAVFLALLVLAVGLCFCCSNKKSKKVPDGTPPLSSVPVGAVAVALTPKSKHNRPRSQSDSGTPYSTLPGFEPSK